MNQKAFSEFLHANGAEVLEPTSPWEIARFRAHGAVHIVYRNKDGIISAVGFASECMAAFAKNVPIAMGYASKRKHFTETTRKALLSRDGNECFFCAGEITKPEAMSIEHLVPKQKGGSDHMDNLVLAHVDCNQKAGNIPLIAKIRIYCRNRIHGGNHAR